jgi:hypothetical protein
MKEETDTQQKQEPQSHAYTSLVDSDVGTMMRRGVQRSAYGVNQDPDGSVGSLGGDPEPMASIGGGAVRFPNTGGSLENLSVRSFSMSYAFISAKPGLWVPTTLEAKAESSLVAC